MFEALHKYLQALPSPTQTVSLHSSPTSLMESVVQLELTEMFTGVSAMLKQTSGYTQFMNICYKVDRQSKALVLELSPHNHTGVVKH